MLIISFVGMLIWLPLKLLGCICPCCCLCTCILEMAEAVLEGLIKLPFKAAMWVGDAAGGDKSPV